MKTTIILATLALLCLPYGVAAQGNLVVNGGFDTDASGWVITNVSAMGGYQSSFGNPPGCILLLNMSSADSPMASQAINGLTPGQLYTVSGDYNSGKNVLGEYFQVAFDGVFVFEAAPPMPYNWYSFNFDYTATSTSAVLSLSELDISVGDSYAIDNIAMYAVPEPSTVWLIFLGGGLFVFMRRNRKKQSRT
jgi:hypothetical protein